MNIQLNVHFNFASLVEANSFIIDLQKQGVRISGFSANDFGNLAGTATASEIPPKPDTLKSEPEAQPVGKGKGKKASDSAVPAGEASDVKTQVDASGQASATTVASPSLPTYEKTDLPKRIMTLVETSKTSGDKSKVDALKALLGSMGVKSAKELTPEQVAEFTPKFADVETGQPVSTPVTEPEENLG